MVKVSIISIGILLTALPCIAQESSSQQSFALAIDSQQSAFSVPVGGASTTVQKEDKDAGGSMVGTYGAGGKLGEGGVFIGGYSTGSLLHPAFPGIVFELGMAAHTPSHTVDGVFAANMQPTFYLDRHPDSDKHQHVFLFVNGGYTRFFATGNAADYGGGLIWRQQGNSADFKDTRFEYREYYIAGFGRRQEVRVSWEWGGQWAD